MKNLNLILSSLTFLFAYTVYGQNINSSSTGQASINPNIATATLNTDSLPHGSSLSENINAHCQLVCYPNPAGANTQLRFEGCSNEICELKIIDLKGQTVQSATLHVNRGENIYRLDLGSLPSGAYTLSLANNTGTRFIKMIKN